MLRTCLFCLPLLLVSLSWAVEHPALPLTLSASQLDSLKQGLAPLLALPEADLLKLVPTQSGLYFVGCLNCKSGQQEGQLSEWDWHHPEQVKCKFCGQVYPSEQYPQTGVTEVKTPNGSLAKYPYCTINPSWYSGQEPYRSYFPARVDYHKARFMERAARDFAYAYKLSGDPAYGRRAALILARFAEVFPGYAFHFDYPFQQKVLVEGLPTTTATYGEYRTSRWTWWAYLDISQYLLEAYDLLATGDELKKLSTEQGNDVSVAVEGMLTDMVVQVLRNRDDLTNMSPGMWADFIRAGRVLGKPEYVHTAVSRLRRMMTEMFFYDGSWMEGAPSYHSQVVGSVQGVLQVARGYSDPVGYQNPATGERFDRLDLAKQMPEVGRAQAALERMKLPSGRHIPVHDTWATPNRTPPPAQSKPTITIVPPTP